MKRVLLIGHDEALARYSAFKADVRSAGFEVEFAALDPARLPKSAFGRFFAKRRLSKMTEGVGDDGLILLVEEASDVAWESWMVYALGSPLKKIAVPSRLKDVDNIGETRSGTATYDKLATVEDLKEIDHAALWAAQTCAYRAHVGG